MKRLMLAALLAAGCGPSGPVVHAVRGKLEVADGDVAALAGHHVEAALDGRPTVRASGVIGKDGSFVLESLLGGKVRRGALEGGWRAKIVPADEDQEGRKIRRPPLAARYFAFATSGLAFTVPPSGEVVLRVEARPAR